LNNNIRIFEHADKRKSKLVTPCLIRVPFLIKKGFRMNDKELYQQEKQAQLDKYEVNLRELKNLTSEFDADANRKLDKQIESAELKIKEAKTKLEAFCKARKEEFEADKKAIDETFIAINTHLAMS
jgi:superfamily II RNA helicase